jgi:hypothetical protein
MHYFNILNRAFNFVCIYKTLFLQVLCNSLWYITNQHQTINDAALHKTGVLPVPACFDDYGGFNEKKRKKMKESQLSADQLNSHGQALYSLLLRPVMKSSPEWADGCNDIKGINIYHIVYILKSHKNIIYEHRAF